MNRKIPEEAFTFYAGLGPNRSYAAVAEKYGVNKRSVAKCAAREDWSSRLEAIEKRTRAKADDRLVESLDDMNERHLRIAKALQAKALRALQSMPMDSARDVIRALDLGVKQERLVRGEPTERQSSVEQVIKREYAEWMKVAGVDEGDAEGED